MKLVYHPSDWGVICTPLSFDTDTLSVQSGLLDIKPVCRFLHSVVPSCLALVFMSVFKEEVNSCERVAEGVLKVYLQQLLVSSVQSFAPSPSSFFVVSTLSYCRWGFLFFNWRTLSSLPSGEVNYISLFFSSSFTTRISREDYVHSMSSLVSCWLSFWPAV